MMLFCVGVGKPPRSGVWSPSSCRLNETPRIPWPAAARIPPILIYES